MRTDHPYYVGMQAHPEFCSRPLNPSPGFLGFVAAAAGILDEQIDNQRSYLMPHPDRHLRYPSPVPSPKPQQNGDFARAESPELLVNGVKSLSVNGQ